MSITKFKVLFTPEGAGAGLGGGTALPPVDGLADAGDRDILNGDDDADEIPDGASGKRKGKSQIQEETEDEEVETPDDEESDGTEDEVDDDSTDEDTDDEDEDDDEDEEDDEEKEDDEELALKGDLTKAVKKLAPDLFKKLPGLREALVRDQQYSEVFSSPEEAKAAAKNTEMLAAMYADISSGDVEKTGKFLKAIEGTNKEAFEDFSHTILESIGKINPQLYGEVMLKPMKKALMAMYHDALKTGNRNLANVALHAHNYWFDTTDIKAPLEERKKATKTKEQEEWEKEKEQYETSKLQEFRGGITEIVNHSMKLSITKELDGIKLDDYQKRNVIRDIFSEVDQVLGADKRYLNGIQSLFDQAKSAKYSSDWKSKIVKTYLQRARQALPAIRNKVLKEAGIKVAEKLKSESRRIVPAGLGGRQSEDQIDFARLDRTKTKDIDILNGTPKYLKEGSKS